MSQYWLMHVFDHLSFSDLHSCYKVNKLWREAATFPGLSIYAGAPPISSWVLSNLSYTFLTRLTRLSFAGGLMEMDWGADKVIDRVTTTLVSSLPYLDNLRSLDLSGTRVTDQLTKSLLDRGSLPSLQTLNLTSCKQLRDFRPIQSLVQTRYPIKVLLGDNQFQSRYKKTPRATHITFLNTTSFSVYPCWLDFSGKMVYDAKIPSGGHCTQNSYDSHPWVILTESGETIMRLAATKHPQVVRIGDCYPVSLVPKPQKLATVAKDKEVSIMIHNKTETSLGLSSLDFSGNDEHTEQIAPSSKITIKTHETVPWMVWDEDEGLFEHVTIVATKESFTHMAVHEIDGNLTCTRYGHMFSANQ